MILTFKTKIPQQIEAARYWNDSVTEQILYGGAKGGGKSFLGAFLIFNDALIYPETHYFIARQELTDLRKFTIPTIYEVFNKLGLSIEDYAKFDGQYNIFTLYNGSKVFLIACKEQPSDPLFERFGSMQMTKGWIEEGGEVSEAAKSNLWLSIGRWKNNEYKLKKKLLITANPKKGWMKREFIDCELPPQRKFIKAFATDNSYLPKDYVETLKNEKDSVRRQRLFEGRWDYDEDQDSLVTYDALTDTFSNTIVKDNQKYLTVDVARSGRDSTVFGFWEGLELIRLDKFHKQDTFNTEQKIKDFAAIEHIPWSNIIIDEDGIGGGVVDHLSGVKGFVANSSPLPTLTEISSRIKYIDDFAPKTNFKNLKTQCAFKLASLINEHKVSFVVPEYRDLILEELSALLRHKDADKDGKLQIKPKDEVKIALGRSPDIGDSIIFRMWFELKKDAYGQENIQPVIEKQVRRLEQNKRNLAINSCK